MVFTSKNIFLGFITEYWGIIKKAADYYVMPLSNKPLSI
jgi:hypothetical protein